MKTYPSGVRIRSQKLLIILKMCILIWKVKKKKTTRKKMMIKFKSFIEGSETWEAGYKRRVVKTTKPEHKDKGYNWRIKGKDRPEISIKLYKEKPTPAQFNKQMKRVAGHEFG